MNQVQRNIVSGLLALLIVPFLSYGLGFLFYKFQWIDDYGYSGPYFLQSI